MTNQGRQFFTAADADHKCGGVIQRAQTLGLQPTQLIHSIESEVFTSPDYRYAKAAAASSLLNDFENSPTGRAGKRVAEGGRLGGLKTAQATARDRSICREKATEVWSRNPNLSAADVARRLISNGTTERALSTVRGYISDLNPKKESC